MSNLLAMPLVQLAITTGNNEDWIDSICYLVDGTDPATDPQLDLTGINFLMEIRRQPNDHEVVIRASTTDGTLAIGEAPNYGFLLIQVDHETMRQQNAGAFVGDIVGTDDVSTRRVAGIDLTIQEGITRP